MAHTINDYIELITSQYQNLPKYKKWVERLLTPYIDTQKLASTLYTYFDIDKAVGKQLDMLGEVIGVKRLLPFNPEGSGTGTPNPIFNKSAFTVVGNPTITDDGIASGFSVNNYIKTPNVSGLSKITESLKFTSSFVYNTLSAEQTIWNKNLNFDLRLINSSIILRTYDGSKFNAFSILQSQHKVANGEQVFCDVVITPNLCRIKINGVEYTKEQVTDFSYLINAANKSFLIGMSNAFNFYFHTSIDLKQFSITIDGKEVFSGSQLNPLLDDENYRFLLKAQILRNVWNGTNQHIYEIWNELHSDIAIAIKDNQDMTVTALFIGDLNKLQQEMIKYGMIVPKAQGVKMFYAFSLPPLFSYDQDTEYFKGYDEGNWAEGII